MVNVTLPVHKGDLIHRQLQRWGAARMRYKEGRRTLWGSVTRGTILSTALAAGLAAAGNAHATVIYDNGSPNQATFDFSDTSFAYTESADEFTLSAGSNTISGVNWWGACVSQNAPSPTCPAGAFTLYFYTDSSNTPGALITSYAVGNANQTATGKTVSLASGEYSYSANIPDLALTAGTQYWLGISDTTTTDFIWGWETTGSGDNDHYQYLAGTGWTAQIGELAFNLTGPAASAVPEPASLAMFGVGVLGLAAIRRRRALRR